MTVNCTVTHRCMSWVYLWVVIGYWKILCYLNAFTLSYVQCRLKVMWTDNTDWYDPQLTAWSLTPVAYSKLSQKSNMELFASLVHNGKPLNNFAKSSIFCQRDSEYVSGLTARNPQTGWIAAHNSEIVGKQSLGGVLQKRYSQNSQENTCARVSFNKVAGWGKK